MTTPTRIPGDTFTDEDDAYLNGLLFGSLSFSQQVAIRHMRESITALRAEVERLTTDLAESERARQRTFADMMEVSTAHTFCDENRADLRRHRDALSVEVRNLRILLDPHTDETMASLTRERDQATAEYLAATLERDEALTALAAMTTERDAMAERSRADHEREVREACLAVARETAVQAARFVGMRKGHLTAKFRFHGLVDRVLAERAKVSTKTSTRGPDVAPAVVTTRAAS